MLHSSAGPGCRIQSAPWSPLWPSRQAEIHGHHLPKNNETFPEMAINIPCHDNTHQSLFDPGKCFKTQQSGIFFGFVLMPLYLLVTADLAVPR